MSRNTKTIMTIVIQISTLTIVYDKFLIKYCFRLTSSFHFLKENLLQPINHCIIEIGNKQKAKCDHSLQT
ncbi:hypothetical protein BpHYR1_030682 [Brachionus plicatilis]|uniref:Uncharacterized protein n=1 Tax=Brachionus plicatilis TaxID=10195 RepID=A0A3M7R7C9_BRAPC|nr:hypothetical protein BpHYR1_030682 [Brachionus plicatilis]